MDVLVQSARVFTERDQRDFAELSGDGNPMHLDALAARRTQAGAPVVHGMHAVLWALDILAASGLLVEPVASLAVRFRKFIYVGAAADVRYERSVRGLHVRIESDGLDCISLDIRFGPCHEAAPAPRAGPRVSTGKPLALDLPEIAEQTGRLSAAVHGATGAQFPHATRRLGPARVQGIARLSTLVGVVCPGLYSIFDGFSLVLNDENGTSEPELAFAVTSLDDRFRFVTMAVAGSGFSGTVDAFVRHPPIEQATLRDARNHVDRAEFAGVSALVVGGSRGLGAATARLLIAGGGRVAVTYRVGRTEALALAAELGDRCVTLPFDATAPAAPQLESLPWKLDQTYYFATAQIFREQAAAYSHARFIEFCNVYVEGFERLVAAVRAHGSPTSTIFYPSSSAVAERPRKMTEYAMAKAAGEVLCADLTRAFKGTRVVVERLPRVLTDQTSSVVPAEAADALMLMVPVVRRMTALLAR